MTSDTLDQLLQPPSLETHSSTLGASEHSPARKDVPLRVNRDSTNHDTGLKIYVPGHEDGLQEEHSAHLQKLFGPLQLAKSKSSEQLPAISPRPPATTDPGYPGAISIFCETPTLPSVRRRSGRTRSKNGTESEHYASSITFKTPSSFSMIFNRAHNRHHKNHMSHIISGSLEPISQFIATYPRDHHQHHTNRSHSHFSFKRRSSQERANDERGGVSSDVEPSGRASYGQMSRALSSKPLALEGALGQHTSARAELRSTQGARGSNSSVGGAGPKPEEKKKPGGWGKVGGMLAPHTQRQSTSKALDFILAVQKEDQFNLVQAAASRQDKLMANVRSMANAMTEKAEAEEAAALQAEASTDVAPAAVTKSSLPSQPLDQIVALQQLGWEVGIEDINVLHPAVMAMLQGKFQQARVLHNKHRKKMCLVQANPTAFMEEVAKDAEAQYRLLAERARNTLAVMAAEQEQERSAQGFRRAVHTMTSARPIFLPPVIPTEMHDRLPVQEEAKEEVVHIWRLEDSVYVGRKKEADSRDFYDNDRLMQRQFNVDWERVKAKTRFKKMVARDDAGVSDPKALERELKEVYNELIRYQYKRLLRSAFTYYSLVGGAASSGSFLEMSLQQFHKFAQDCNIEDPKSVACKPSDLDTMFVATNFEEESGTEESDANDDNALCRFEFLEIIVRLAFGKFIYSKEMTDASDSVSKLMHDFIEPSLPPEAKLDPDVFRKTRLYKQDVEQVFVRHWELLQATFKVYKARDRTKYFWIEHWFTFLESVDVLGEHTGIDKHMAKLIFAYSQMAVADELKRRQRAVSIMFYDFIEAIARLAEVMSPPTPEELDKVFKMVPPTNPNARVWEYYQRVKAGSTPRLSRASGGLNVETTRPLAVKLQMFMELMIGGLKTAWGGTTVSQVTMRMTKMAMLLSGGIEMS